MKKLALTILLTLVCSFTYAQNNFLDNLNVLFDFGLNYPIDGYHDGDSRIGNMVEAEIRYSFAGTPWSCGITAHADYVKRKFKVNPDNETMKQTNATAILGVTGGYHFRQGKNVNPYANMTLGVAFNRVMDDEVFPSKGVSMAVMPKVGVELFKFLRLGAYCQINREGYNTAGLTIGLNL